MYSNLSTVRRESIIGIYGAHKNMGNWVGELGIQSVVLIMSHADDHSESGKLVSFVSTISCAHVGRIQYFVTVINLNAH